ncbi:MAG TPA: DNA topology modulation protein [Pyrinomonadaceae bacterium]|jgi:adenylate kinase family enzyme
MKKIVIIGSGGAGKSTLAQRLGEATGIEVIHLDKMHWLPGWTSPPKDEWRRTVERLLEKDEYVMDGNFNGTMEMRMQAADTVIYLDFPRTVCFFRALKRIFKYYNKTRPDMGEGCNERFDLEFLRWVWNFPEETKPKIEERLKKIGADKKIIRLRSPKEAENFLRNLKNFG